jgi:hypothetical protein
MVGKLINEPRREDRTTRVQVVVEQQGEHAASDAPGLEQPGPGGTVVLDAAEGQKR